MEVITVEKLIEMLKNYNHKELHVHHTWKPDHSDWGKKPDGLYWQKSMRDYHINTNGWSDIGQHVTLLPNGLFVTGRDFSKDPASIYGYNSGAFAVEMLGNFDIGHDKFEGTQKTSMLRLARYFYEKGKYIRFHRENSEKTCPGSSIDKEKFMQEVKQMDFSFLDETGRRNYYKYGYKGQGITIAVLDSGVDDKHPDLKGKVIEHISFESRFKEPPIDTSGHGTHVAGSICGTNCGVAPETKLISIKVANMLGEIQKEDVLEALKWCYANRDRIDIISMSLTWLGKGKEYPEHEEFINKLVAADIPVIVSSGNTGKEEITYPAYFQEVITVGAVDHDKKYALFSTQSDQVDVCQIGVDVLSCDIKGGYKLMTGTSMATPIVSGIAALILCRYKAIYGKRMPEPELYRTLKYDNTIDIDEAGIDKRTGAGFVSLKKIKEFKDLHLAADWAKPYIQKALEYGLFEGDNSGNFNPKNNVTREEMAAVAVRLYEKLNL